MTNTVVNYADMKPEIPLSACETLRLTGHDLKIISYALIGFIREVRAGGPGEHEQLETKARDLYRRVDQLDRLLHG